MTSQGNVQATDDEYRDLASRTRCQLATCRSAGANRISRLSHDALQARPVAAWLWGRAFLQKEITSKMAAVTDIVVGFIEDAFNSALQPLQVLMPFNEAVGTVWNREEPYRESACSKTFSTGTVSTTITA